MRTIISNWVTTPLTEIDDVADPLVRSSRVFYDDIEDPTKTANDVKNMKREGRDANKE